MWPSVGTLTERKLTKIVEMTEAVVMMGEAVMMLTETAEKTEAVWEESENAL